MYLLNRQSPLSSFPVKCLDGASNLRYLTNTNANAKGCHVDEERLHICRPWQWPQYDVNRVQCMMRYSVRQLQGPILWRPNRQMITLWHNFKYKKPLPGLVWAGWNSVMKKTETRWCSAMNPSCNQLAFISFHACPEHYSSILLNVFLIFFVMLLTDTCAPIIKFHDEDCEHPYIFYQLLPALCPSWK